MTALEATVTRPIPPLDLLFYLLETHDNPKHVAGLQIFQLPEDAGPTYLIDLVESLRASPAIEPFNFKPHFPRLGRPEWQLVNNMEMAYHLRHSALPKPGTMEQLLTVVQRLHAGMLDRARPGWICQIIEGLQDNRFAIYSKIHHAYIDGQSGTKRMYAALSNDPDNVDLMPTWGYQPDIDSKTRAHSSKRKRAGLASTAIRQVKALTEVNGQLLKVALELARLRDHSGHIPFRAPRTSINSPVSSDLRSMAVTTMPLDKLKSISKKAGCTINEVVLTLTDAALHDYLTQHGEDPEQPLVAMCPMSLREPGDESANTQVATILIELGERQADLKTRLQTIKKSSAASKADAHEMSRDALIDYLLLIGGSMELLQRTGLEKLVPQTYNVLVSNVPGPGEEAMYLAGSRLLAAYPISTLTPGNNLNLTVLSHGNSLDFGLLGALGSLPDIDFLVERLGAQFTALCKAYRVGNTRKRASPTPSKKQAKAKSVRRKAAKKR